MKVRFLKDTYIRQNPDDLSIPPIGVVYAGTELQVKEETRAAAAFEGNSIWFQDHRGWFYWSGAVVPVQAGEDFTDPVIETDPEPAPLSYDPKRMNWGIGALNIPEQFWDRDLLGQEIGIAILDTGLDYDHFDLKDGIAAYENFCSDAWGGNDDTDGNGTLAAGIIAAGGKYKLYGVAPEASLYVGKIMNHPFDFSFDALIKGLKWAGQLPVEIIYTSLAVPRSAFTEEQISTLSNLMNELLQLGKLVIAPIGNVVHSVPEDRYPAAFSSCLSVGAVDQHGLKLGISAASEQLDIVAPGDEMLTTYLNNETGQFGGTAAAASFMAGLMALVIQHIRTMDQSWHPTELIDLLKQTATPPNQNTKCRDLDYGCGYINTIGLLERLGYDPS